jgi:hypothetical protein
MKARLSRAVALAFALFLSLQAIGIQTVAAAVVEECYSPELEKHIGDGDYNCMTTEIIQQQARPEYDLGYTGATDPVNLTPPYHEWPKEFAPGVSVPGGVHVGASMEVHHILDPGNGMSANMSLSAQPKWADFNGMRTLTTGAIHALQYQFRPNSSDIMNGASEFYWRSPVKFDAANLTAHYLNIVELNDDGTTKRLVAAARYMENRPTTDTTDALLSNERLYYRLSGLFHSDRVYTVNEYVVTREIGGAPLALSELHVYVSEGQDIGGDNLKITRLFPGHGTVERHYGATTKEGEQWFELGWGARFYIGMGAGGTVGLLSGNTTMPTQTLRARFVGAEASLDGNGAPNGNVVSVVIPLRMSKPTTLTVSLTPFRSYAERVANVTGTQAATTRTYTTPEPITGSFVHTFHFPDATWNGATGAHFYDVSVMFNLAGSTDCDLAQCTHLSYPMSEEQLPDGTTAWHIVDMEGAGLQSSHAVYAQPWVELNEGYDPASSDPSADIDSSTNWASVLVGSALLLGGILLAAVIIAITAPVSIPLLLVMPAVLVAGGVVAGGAMFIGTAVIYGGSKGVSLSEMFLGAEGWDAVTKFAGTLVAATACGAMFVPGVSGWAGRKVGAGAGLSKNLPAFVGKAALGATCAAGLLLAGGGLEGLLDFVVDFVKVIQKAFEMTGQVMAALAHYALVFLENLEPWVKAAYIAFSALTILWAIREGLLWLLNMLWPITSSMGPQARSHAQRFENIVENISVPLWDTVMYKHGAIRGRYRRLRKGGNPD